MNAYTDPAKVAAASTPVPAPAHKSPTFWLDDLQELNDAVGGAILKIKYDHRDFTDRTLMAHLSNSAFKLMAAISTRTLSYGKAAETIVQDQFLTGMRKAKGDRPLRKDARGLSVFEGTGMSRNTIRDGLKELQSFGLCSSFNVMIPKTGVVTAYMPFTWRSLYIMMADRPEYGFDRLSSVFKKWPNFFELALKSPAHELEALYWNHFLDGIGAVKEIECTYKNDLSRVQIKKVHDAIWDPQDQPR